MMEDENQLEIPEVPVQEVETGAEAAAPKRRIARRHVRRVTPVQHQAVEGHVGMEPISAASPVQNPVQVLRGIQTYSRSF